MNPKSPSYVKSDPQSDVKLTPSSYKIIQINKENVCFWKVHFNMPKVTPASVQSYHQVIQSHPQIPKLTPNCYQNQLNMTPGRFGPLGRKLGPASSCPLGKAKYVGKMCISCLWARLGGQVTPKSFQSDPKVVQSDLHTPKVTPN